MSKSQMAAAILYICKPCELGNGKISNMLIMLWYVAASMCKNGYYQKWGCQVNIQDDYCYKN